MTERKTRIVEVELPNGATMLAEVSVPETLIETSEEGSREKKISRSGNAPVSTPMIAETTHSFKAIMDSVAGIAEAVSTTIEKTKALEASVEFGIELSVKTDNTLTGLFVKGDGKASMKVILKFSSSSKETIAPIKKVE